MAGILTLGFLFYKVCSPTPWPIREYIGGSILVLRVSIFPNYLLSRRSKFIGGCPKPWWIEGSYSALQLSCPCSLIVLNTPTSGIAMHLYIISWGYFLFPFRPMTMNYQVVVPLWYFLISDIMLLLLLYFLFLCKGGYIEIEVIKNIIVSMDILILVKIITISGSDFSKWCTLGTLEGWSKVLVLG